METILIALGICNLIVLIYLLFLRKNQDSGLGSQVLQTLVDYQDRQKAYQSQEFDALRTSLDKKLGEGLEKSRETLGQVMERLVRVDSAQKQISSLSENVASLQSVLTDKKSRGIFGEVQLTQVLTSIFGEAQQVYRLQQTLSNGKIADAVLDLPEPLGLLAVDSKFPLENYRRTVDNSLSQEERERASREFAKNLKKHIDDISEKYIIHGETSDQAILFLPAEAIFSELHAYHSDVIEYAARKKVWLTSPTTLMAILSTVQTVLKNIERNKHIDEIQEEIRKLGEDFFRYEERWDDLCKHLDTVQKDVDKIQISSRKLSDRFKDIARL